MTLKPLKTEAESLLSQVQYARMLANSPHPREDTLKALRVLLEAVEGLIRHVEASRPK